MRRLGWAAVAAVWVGFLALSWSTLLSVDAPATPPKRAAPAVSYCADGTFGQRPANGESGLYLPCRNFAGPKYARNA